MKRIGTSRKQSFGSITVFPFASFSATLFHLSSLLIWFKMCIAFRFYHRFGHRFPLNIYYSHSVGSRLVFNKSSSFVIALLAFQAACSSHGIWEKTQGLLYLDVTSERIFYGYWTCVCIWEVIFGVSVLHAFSGSVFILSGACPFSVLSPFFVLLQVLRVFQGPFGCHVFQHLMSECLLCYLI